MTDQKFRKGQRVKVLGIIDQPAADIDGDWHVRIAGAGGGHDIAYARPDQIEALPDDPATDPVGTVRKKWDCSYVLSESGSALAYSDFRWLNLSRGSSNGHENMRDSKVIGAVPGTPAFEVYGHLNGGAE